MSLYLTAILPPQQLSEEIDDIRKEIAARFDVHAALKPPVHITLFRPVSMRADMEQHLIKWLKPVGTQHEPFTQELENFDSFNNKTLFIHCIKNTFIHNLQKDVATVFNKNKIDPREVKGSSRFHPHITIAYRDVQPQVFETLWTEFKNRKLKRSFMVNHFTLLKHDGKKWQPFEEFQLHKPANLMLF